MFGLKWCLKFILSALLIVGHVEFVKALEDVEILFLNFNKELLEYNKRVSALAWEGV
jgi:hypothetical protein